MRIRERRDVDLEELEAVARRVHASDRYPVYLPDGGFRRFLTEPVDIATAAPAVALYEADGWRETARVSFDLDDLHLAEIVFTGSAI